MNCQISQNSLSAYLDRELPGDEMLSVRSHVERCAECQAELESLRRMKSALGSLPMAEPREGLESEILRRVRAEQPAAPRVPMGLMVATSVAAAVLAVFAFNAFFGVKPAGQYAREETTFDQASDTAVTSPDFGSHAPLIPVGR